MTMTIHKIYETSVNFYHTVRHHIRADSMLLRYSYIVSKSDAVPDVPCHTSSSENEILLQKLHS
jgi:hypothetical protein